ncbi:MAG: cyclomaltodextrinase N-terminal domain-containing protein, partial [Flavobacteriales bacterium]|nr:cyclomaltodextrinase N-terminal domain-containing protein [Flavobacteriales bacterium]
MKRILTLLFVLIAIAAQAQYAPELKFYPPNWWTEMPEEEFQLMVYGVSKTLEVKVADDSEVEIVGEHFVDNERYVFLDIRVPKSFDGDGFGLEFIDGDFRFKMTYPLLKRDDSPNIHSGINSSDLIYLIFPDRFANGNEENDVNLSMTDKRVKRDS